MSRQAVQAVINRAVTDSEFRQELFAKPHQALTEYDLTEAEVAALRTIDVDTLESLARRPAEHVSDSLAIGLYTGMLAANRQNQVPRGKDVSGLEEEVRSQEHTRQVAVTKQWMDLEQSTRKEVRKMKRWQILATVVAMVAVGLAGYAVGASRQATDIAVDVESQLASGALAAEEEASAVEEIEVDCTEDGWVPENNFYQPIKVHIDWDLGDPDPSD